jgi:WD40 repeat protein/tRNA A-37 threonylcarbamoyl transferase component Bud32
MILEDQIFSAGQDGLLLKQPDANNETVIQIHDSQEIALYGLAFSKMRLVTIKGEFTILLLQLNNLTAAESFIVSLTPLTCISATESLILAGSKLGEILAWDAETLSMAFALKGHSSQPNFLLPYGDVLYSGSNDRTIIQWSLSDKSMLRVLTRLSTSSLGHLGPVNSLTICKRVLFSGGSDLTVRRWNTFSGKHEDVYRGVTKSVTSVLCVNDTLFAGSEDFSVLLYRPSFPVTTDSISTNTKIASVLSKRRKTRLAQVPRINNPVGIESVALYASIGLISFFLLLTSIVFVLKKRSLKKAEVKTGSVTSETESNITVGDLATVVNSVMGISRHAAYIIDNFALAKVKKLTSGGGGELFISKIMDNSLRKRIGETVIQKVVFVKNQAIKEAFYQEVGIMITLSTFPHICKILGYTEDPSSIIMKLYEDGSLFDWVRSKKYNEKWVPKVLKEISRALQAMHTNFLAHCDIKTQNVLIEYVNETPSCYLTDFGITQVLSEKIIATRAFNIKNLKGLSVQFAAPEAFQNFKSRTYKSVDFKKYDLYSFGCVIYEATTKKAPWYNL